jgi:hypothetical protein
MLPLAPRPTAITLILSKDRDPVLSLVLMIGPLGCVTCNRDRLLCRKYNGRALSLEERRQHLVWLPSGGFQFLYFPNLRKSHKLASKNTRGLVSKLFRASREPFCPIFLSPGFAGFALQMQRPPGSKPTASPDELPVITGSAHRGINARWCEFVPVTPSGRNSSATRWN